MTLQHIVKELASNPKILFLIDAFGAMLTALSLSLILTTFESVFGMPRKTLYFLTIPAVIFCIYSFSCFALLTENWRPYLIGIVIGNTLYCFLSVGMMYYHYQELKTLGMIYFILEIIIVIAVISIELKAIRQLKSV